MPQEPSAIVVRVADPPEARPGDVGYAVMPRETLVDERVIGRQQLHQASVFAYEVGEEQLRLAPHRLGQLLIEIRVRQSIGLNFFKILEPQPLRGEPSGQSIGTWIRKQPPPLGVEHSWARKLSPCREADQLCVGRCAPQEE